MKTNILATSALLTLISLGIPVHAENLTHTRQLLSTKSCSECDLSGVGLVLSDLQGADLQGANLVGANLSRANLTGANLSGANLSSASLNGANLTGANLSNATVLGTDLRGAYLTNAVLTDLDLSTAYIQGVIGIPTNAGTKEQFYEWATVEGNRGNYNAALEHYNRALTIDPDFAPAYLGRSLVFYRFGNNAAAVQDARMASMIFSAQDNEEGHLAAEDFILGMTKAREPDKVEGRGNFGNVIRSVGSLLLRFLM